MNNDQSLDKFETKDSTVSVRDIARALNISPSTVSRVLSRKQPFLISETTRQRVLKAAKDMGYRFEHPVESLSDGWTRIIAIWSPGLHLSLFKELVYVFQGLLRQVGYEIITSEYGRHTASGLDASVITGFRVDGIIVIGSGAWLKDYVDKHSIFAPIVNISGVENGNGDLVKLDYYPAAKEALERLIRAGRRRIAYVTMESILHAQDSRYRAYAEAMRESGLETEVIIPPGNFRYDAYRSIKDYVGSNGLPDAIFCNNDDIAIGIYKGLRELSVRIPEDTALIGCDGIEDNFYTDTSISSIMVPHELKCQKAWEFLQNRIENPGIPRQYVSITAELLLRESTGDI